MSEIKEILKDFITGGWVVSVIGGLGMAARLLLESRKMTIIEYIKRILAAVICSSIAWFILEQIDVSSLTKAICYGITGVVSPEIVSCIILLAKKFSKKPEDLLKK
jgi:hypothetical protein